MLNLSVERLLVQLWDDLKLKQRKHEPVYQTHCHQHIIHHSWHEVVCTELAWITVRMALCSVCVCVHVCEYEDDNHTLRLYWLSLCV